MLYEGIVEDDSIGYGKCLVRIFSKHSNDRSILPTEDLQEAKIIYPAESNIDEQSYFRTITNGTWVIIDFLDRSQQYPVILGSIVKTVKALPDFTKGFSDPDQLHPDSDHLNESTISRLARNEKISETISQIKTDERQTAITCVDATFDQPPNPYNAVYPHNRVLQTKNHVIEIDDTPNNERIDIYHKSGTFHEISPDGTETNKIKNDMFLSINGDNNVVVSGDINLKSDGNVNIDGTIINLNGSSDFAVAFNALNTEIIKLKTELNLIVTAYNAAVYNIAGVGTTGTTSNPAVPVTIDISNAKVDDVKLKK